ncbi:Required for respiratory growth protein 9 mitochondrial [Varicellaria rhodocarpa]|nr:Required for respiratory growth protein 9 mitochondrial [Varicellaria rhodocarpa]
MPCSSSSTALSGCFLRSVRDLIQTSTIYKFRPLESQFCRKHSPHNRSGAQCHYSRVEVRVSSDSLGVNDHSIPFESSAVKPASSLSGDLGKEKTRRDFGKADVVSARHTKSSQLRTVDRALATKPVTQNFRSKSRTEVNKSKSSITEDQTATFRHREQWQVQKHALKEKFGTQGWMPRKRLSPDALEGIRALHSQHPEKYSTPVLAEQFKVSPEAIRRILRSKWRPTEEEEADRLKRWDKRGESIWSQMVEVGVKPPKKWREMGISRPPSFHSSPAKVVSSIKASVAKTRDFPTEPALAVPKGKDSMTLSLSDRIL